MKTTTLIFVFLLAILSVQASDIIYTINVTEKAIPATMDSLKFVNKRNNEVVRFSDVPKLSMFKVNLSTSLIETSIPNINYNNLIKLAGGSDGKLTVTSDYNEPIPVQITITNLIGQNVYSSQAQLTGSIDIMLPLRQVYIVKVYSKQGIQSTKCMGSEKITDFSVVSLDSKLRTTLQKTASIKINADLKINIGDTLLLTAYKKDLYPKAIQLIAQQNADVTVDFDTTAVTDIDGNIYKTVKIGTQVWMAKDLMVSRYPDGTLISLISNNTDWAAMGNYETANAHCFYNYSNNSNKRLGAFYTFKAAQNACPTGWHLPSLEEWTILEKYIADNGYENKEGNALKYIKYRNATDNYGFSAQLTGYISYIGTFDGMGLVGDWWTSSLNNDNTINFIRLDHIASIILRYKAYNNKPHFSCVRCIKDK